MIVGVAGCGRMGMGMARALDAAGHTVRGFDIAAKSAPFMVDLETFRAETEIVFTVVRDAAETDALLFETQRLIDGPCLRHLVVSSTLSPRYVTALRDKVPSRITLTDAPMSGAQVAADEARLSFMLGGEDATLDLLQPYLNAMGAHFHRMGPYGSGAAAKVLNNLVAASSVAATRTALSWADELGVSEDKLLALMHTSSGQTWFGSGFGQIEFARDGYAPDNTIGILVKDVAAALDAAPEGADKDLGVALMQTIRGLSLR
jgi:3-hydroxyisobutyrate dehydrogenase-like beta-hydroxyacid dehydrogenase